MRPYINIQIYIQPPVAEPQRRLCIADYILRGLDAHTAN
jgi:hypothetical protein